MSYNLLDEKWIPVLYNDGRFQRVGIRTALNEAGHIRQIAASNPMDRIAILRFLLAILYWCKGTPPNTSNSHSPHHSQHFPNEWFDLLNEHQDYFDLLGKSRRFYQVSSAKRPRPITDLIQEIPTGNNFWHFHHSTDYMNGMCPSCCAMGLLRLPLFSVSGLPDLRTGVNGRPPIYVLPTGKTLLDTLLLNWTKCSEIGTPAWLQPDVRISITQNVPVVTGMTLLSRHVWLHDNDCISGICIACGQQNGSLIRTCEYQSAGDLKNDTWNDPHVIYSTGKKRKACVASDPTAPKSFKMDKPWINLFAELAASSQYLPLLNTSKLWFVGFATDNAKNIDVWERECGLSSLSLIEDVAVSIADKLKSWQTETDKLPFRLKKNAHRKHSELVATINNARPHVDTLISKNVADLLANSKEAWQQAVDGYRQTMATIAQSLAPGFTTKALIEQDRIKNTLPDIERAKKTNARNTKVKKEGDQ